MLMVRLMTGFACDAEAILHLNDVCRSLLIVLLGEAMRAP